MVMDPGKYDALVDFRTNLLRADREAKRRVDAEEAPAREPLRALTLEELFNRPRPDYLIDAWFPEGGLCEVVGPPETLKSFVMCHAGLLIASGKGDFFGYSVVRQGPVLYIAAEGGGAFQYRVRAWCHKQEVDPLRVPFRVIPLPVNLRDASFQRELLEIVHAVKPILVVVDTLSRCTPGAEENSARDMGEVVSFCTEMQNISGAAVVFIHHPTKSDPNGAGRGSGVILGAVDTELRTAATGEQHPDGSLPVRVLCAKQKDDLKPPPLDLLGYVVPVRDLQGRPMAHESGRLITTLLMREATSADVDHSAQVNASAIEKAVLDYLKVNPDKTKEEIRKGIGKNREIVAEAVDRLTRDGRLDMVKSSGRGGKGRGKCVYSMRAVVWDSGSDDL